MSLWRLIVVARNKFGSTAHTHTHTHISVTVLTKVTLKRPVRSHLFKLPQIFRAGRASDWVRARMVCKTFCNSSTAGVPGAGGARTVELWILFAQNMFLFAWAQTLCTQQGPGSTECVYVCVCVFTLPSSPLSLSPSPQCMSPIKLHQTLAERYLSFARSALAVI